jgi:hypothetical protein
MGSNTTGSLSNFTQFFCFFLLFFCTKEKRQKKTAAPARAVANLFIPLSFCGKIKWRKKTTAPAGAETNFALSH